MIPSPAAGIYHKASFGMITRPVLIVGCPRSGTTLLFNILSEVSSLWSIGYESKAIIERHHHPRAKGWESGVLTAADLTVASGRQIVADFERQAAPGTFWRRVNRLRRALASRPSYRALKRRGRTTGPGSAVSSRVPHQGLELVRAYVRLRNRLRGPGRRPIR
jgi:hypothetical protein